MTDLTEIAVAVGTLLMAGGTFLMAWKTHSLAQIASHQVRESILARKESVLRRKRKWEKMKVDYLHTLLNKIKGRILELPKDEDIAGRIPQKIRDQRFNSLGIEQDRINRTEVFSLLPETFLGELDKQSEKYEKIVPKERKQKDDFAEMKRSLNRLEEITAEELDSSKRELGSITQELKKM